MCIKTVYDQGDMKFPFETEFKMLTQLCIASFSFDICKHLATPRDMLADRRAAQQTVVNLLHSSMI